MLRKLCELCEWHIHDPWPRFSPQTICLLFLNLSRAPPYHWYIIRYNYFKWFWKVSQWHWGHHPRLHVGSQIETLAVTGTVGSHRCKWETHGSKWSLVSCCEVLCLQGPSPTSNCLLMMALLHWTSLCCLYHLSTICNETQMPKGPLLKKKKKKKCKRREKSSVLDMEGWQHLAIIGFVNSVGECNILLLLLFFLFLLFFCYGEVGKTGHMQITPVVYIQAGRTGCLRTTRSELITWTRLLIFNYISVVISSSSD